MAAELRTIWRGLSPLTRGNRLCQSLPAPNQGPIPAHAGQPASMGIGGFWIRAYPRSRGATRALHESHRHCMGLSPLTRGNLEAGPLAPELQRPIPAHAGQPLLEQRLSLFMGAYPRSRGATPLERKTAMAVRGLSPLTRGNLRRRPSGRAGWGPIPAHAGQPLWTTGQANILRAYPRSRGATSSSWFSTIHSRGLSPLTRGNPATCTGYANRKGPIPAHAGQPLAFFAHNAIIWAYPRSRGATTSAPERLSGNSGLSPLTRGNRVVAPLLSNIRGPIPAHAGQPRQA